MLVSRFANETMPASDKTVYAWWQEENKPSDFTYTGTDKITVTGYVGQGSTMWIPAYIGGNPVVTITKEAFINKTQLQKVVVPDTVTSIGLGAFKGCNGIEDITLPFVGASQEATYYNAVFGYIFGYEEAPNEYKNYGMLNDKNGFVEYSGVTTYYYVKPNYSFLNVKHSDINNLVWQYTCCDYKGVAGGTYDYQGFTPWYRYVMTSKYYYIPKTIKSVKITCQINIPLAAFNNCDFIETITLSENVESIGDYALQNCNATILYE